MNDRLALSVLSLLCVFSTSARAAETVVLSTLDWPPYCSTHLPDDGVSPAIVTAAFAAEGVTVRYEFLPWNRAMQTARDGGADGVFPAYERPPNPRWVYSDSIGVGPIYFVERKDHPIRWSSLDDLRGLLIGVDAGYVNTPEIDRRIADGRLHADASESDGQNLYKLVRRRIDLAIIDANVFHFLSTKLAFAAVAPQLQLQAEPLENKELFVDFRNDARGRHFRDLLNRGLQKLGATDGARVAALQTRLMAQ